MKLPIEKWAEEHELPKEATEALQEACRSFKAGEYSADLLFSYLAWNLVLRRRIMAARCPPGFPQGRWDALQADMTNEDKWDGEVFGSTQTKGPVPIFDVSDDLRTQVRFWKDRRNDCAHLKDNRIDDPHVE